MLSRLTNLVAWVLALNFLCAAGGVAYLVATKKLDKAKVQEIRTLILAPATQPTTQPTTAPTTQISPDAAPIVRLEAALAQAAGRPAPEQAEIVQTTFDTQNAMLERQLREIEDKKRQVDKAAAEVAEARRKLEEDRKQLSAKTDEASKLAEDKGFQETLTLYQSMAPKKAKELMKAMNDDVVVRYLRSMETRTATNILKEFKTPEEISRAQAIMEKMRQAQAEAN